MHQTLDAIVTARETKARYREWSVTEAAMYLGLLRDRFGNLVLAALRQGGLRLRLVLLLRGLGGVPRTKGQRYVSLPNDKQLYFPYMLHNTARIVDGSRTKGEQEDEEK